MIAALLTLFTVWIVADVALLLREERAARHQEPCQK